MPTNRLTNAASGGVIDVEVPPTGLSIAYARAGWVDEGPTPEPVDKPEPKSVVKAAAKPPAEPVTTRPALPSDETKE